MSYNDEAERWDDVLECPRGIQRSVLWMHLAMVLFYMVLLWRMDDVVGEVNDSLDREGLPVERVYPTPGLIRCECRTVGSTQGGG